MAAKIKFLGLCLIFSGHSLWATLGERVESIEKVRASLDGMRKSPVAYKAYSVTEVASEVVSIKEFSGPDGIVFAISWKGPIQPDLEPFLGDRIKEYGKSLAGQKKRAGRSSSNTTRGKDLVVEKFGHMRWMGGRAYIPSLMPAGVTLHAIQ